MQQYFPLILIVLAVLLLFVMPSRQRKRAAAQAQTLQNSLRPGTPVMTTSGIHGTVARLDDATIDLEIAPGTVVTFERRAVLQVRQPVAGTDTGTKGIGDTGTAGTGTTGTGTTGTGTTEFGGTGDDTPGSADGPADRAH
jgi:preprotein translocase subunit YajC